MSESHQVLRTPTAPRDPVHTLVRVSTRVLKDVEPYACQCGAAGRVSVSNYPLPCQVLQWCYLHAIVKAELLTDQRPLKLHLVLRLVAEAERDPDRRAT